MEIPGMTHTTAADPIPAGRHPLSTVTLASHPGALGLSRSLLTTEEVAHALAVSETLVRQLTHAADIPCRRIGRLVRFARPMSMRSSADATSAATEEANAG